MTPPAYGWNGKTYVPGDVPEDLLRILQHICRFWKDGASGWAASEASRSIQNIEYQSLLHLAEEIKMWCSGHNLSPGQLLLAWVGLGAIAEGALHWFLSVYAEGYLQDPIFTNTGAMVPPEDLFFFKSIVYLDQRIWPDDGKGSFTFKKKMMSTSLHDIRKKRNTIHCGKVATGTWTEWRNNVRHLLAVICELEGRVPYPDEYYAYPLDVSEIVSFYGLGKEVQLGSESNKAEL